MLNMIQHFRIHNGSKDECLKVQSDTKTVELSVQTAIHKNTPESDGPKPDRRVAIPSTEHCAH
jgi:hypothetical protein